MRIASITIEGLKGQHGALELQPRAVLLGPNGRGKSAWTDAVRFAALGFVPALGRLEAATGKLLCGHELKVSVALDDGRQFYRTLSNGGTYRSFAWASWVPSTAPSTQHADAIRSLFGATLDEAAECLDLRELLRAGPQARSQKINALLDATGSTAETRAKVARTLTLSRLTETPEQGATDELMLPHLAPAMREVLDQINFPKLFAMSLDVGIEQAKAFKKTATDESKRQAAARSVAPQAGSFRPVAEIAADRAKLADEIKAAEEKLAQAKARREAEAEVVELNQTQAPPPKPEGDPEALTAEAERLTNEAADVEFPAAPIHQMEPCTKADELEAQASDIEVPDDPDMPSAQAALQEAEKALALAKESPWREVERIAEVLRKECEAFGRSLSAAQMGGLDTLVALAERHGKSLRALKNQVKIAEENVASARIDAGLRAKALAERSDLLAKAAAARQAWHTSQAEGARKRIDEHAKATAEAKAKVLELTKQAETKRREAAALRVAISTHEDAASREADRARASAAAEARLAALPPAEEPAAIRIKLAELGRKSDTLADEQKRAEDSERRSKDLATVAAAQRKAECERDVWKEIEWALLRLREREIEGRAAPLVSRMSAFFAAAGITDRTPFVRVLKGSIDFGWVSNGTEVSIETMSGGETVLFATALARAVVQIRKPQVSCLMVEAAEADDETTRQLLAGLAEEGVDNVLVATCHSVAAVEGWQRIECVEQPASARF